MRTFMKRRRRPGYQLRVTLSRFHGQRRADVREFYDAGNVYKPGKRGISLHLDHELPEVIRALKRILTRVRGGSGNGDKLR